VPRHKIEMSQPSKMMLHNDVGFDIFSDGKKLGTLTISKGSIDWWPKRKRSGKRMTWEKFATLMNEQALG
jgi:hypothetical protein